MRPLASLLCLLAIVRGASAQESDHATLRGAVVSETGDRIPYAVLVLIPGFSQRFADENGFFALARVPVGRYELRVRQVGFSPFDSTIDVTAATPQLRIELKRIAVRLADITVGAPRQCRTPVPPDSGTALGVVFDQLRQNAERSRLMAQRYPFRAQMLRTFTSLRREFPDLVRQDSIWLPSWTIWNYSPGHMVEPDTEGFQPGTKLVHVMTIENLADSAFWGTHCFSTFGNDTAEGRAWLRVDFRVAASIHTPDIDGSAYLDPDSYKLGVFRFTLTHVERAVVGVDRWTATTTFKEIRPSVPVPDQVRSEQLNARSMGVGVVTAILEVQRLIDVSFVRPPGNNRDSMP
ncbi:MAG TPA: carboxypeptidase-like regulatory domain-containing protein [Gemmatimonadales bacterium]|jgi:hypothetical protein